MNKHIHKILGLLQHGKQIQQASPTYQRPPLKTPEEWRIYWQKQGQPWRTEPQIDRTRQEYLAKQRLITPNIEQGIYPFKGEKLSRADVEWLLATHENGRGPVDWSDESQRERKGLDLRGADLRQADLSSLPLTGMCGGSSDDEWRKLTAAQRDKAAVHLEGADLRRTHLEQANFRRACLEQVDLRGAYLERANLWAARLDRASLDKAHLECAILCRAHLEKAFLKKTHLEGTNLCEASFDSTSNLEGAMFGNKQYGWAQVADIRWGAANLAAMEWSQVKMLGDEHKARQRKTDKGEKKDRDRRLREYEVAVRANRQLAVALRDQGLNEEAARVVAQSRRMAPITGHPFHQVREGLICLENENPSFWIEPLPIFPINSCLDRIRGLSIC